MAAGHPSESVMEAKQSDDHDIDDAAAAAIAEVAAVVAGHSYPSPAAGASAAAEQAPTGHPARPQAAVGAQAGAQSLEVKTPPPPPERSPSEEEAILIAHGRSGSILSVLRAADVATAKIAAVREAEEVMPHGSDTAMVDVDGARTGKLPAKGS